MFDAILELAKKYEVAIPNKPAQTMEIPERMEIAQEVIRKLGTTLGVAGANKIRATIFGVENSKLKLLTLNANANSTSFKVSISPFFLITKKEFQELEQGNEANGIRKILGYTPCRASKTLEAKDRQSIDFMRGFYEDCTEETHGEILLQIFAHELGHIHHQDYRPGSSLLLTFLTLSPLLVLGIITAFWGVFGVGLALSGCPFLLLPITLAFITIACFAGFASLRISQDKARHFCHNIEFRADVFSMQAEPNLEAVKTFLEFLGKRSCHRGKGTHPRQSERIMRMTSAKGGIRTPTSEPVTTSR